jgi:hypothetical protein
MVAALYVETNGCYFGLPGVDPWDQERDARLYVGPWPVVAHPPCNKWSPLAYINQRRLRHYHVGDDGGCFRAALNAVRTYGGVLEHPASTLAWRYYSLTKPQRGLWSMPDNYGCVVTEVDQGVYGHRARKRTWLYANFKHNAEPPDDLDWSLAESDAIVSGFTHQPKGAHVACEHRRVRPKEASRTPDAFRDVLLDMARSAGTVDDPTEALPEDLARVLRDQSIIVPQDAAVWALNDRQQLVLFRELLRHLSRGLTREEILDVMEDALFRIRS